MKSKTTSASATVTNARSMEKKGRISPGAARGIEKAAQAKGRASTTYSVKPGKK